MNQPSSPPAPAINPRDISYALSARTGVGRASVRAIENLSGRLQILYRLWGYWDDVAAGDSIWEVAFRRYDLQLDLTHEPGAALPASGPALVLANHPFGILDGLTLGLILSRRRSDFRIIANAVFAQAPELAGLVLPIDFTDSREARMRNVRTRREALAHLKEGGCVAMFPAAAVAAGRGLFDRPFDPEWTPFAARLVRDSDAAVIPLYFDGRNSRHFQFLGHLSPACRFGLHMHEFYRRIGGVVCARVGRPIDRAALASVPGDGRALAAELRRRVYALSAEPLGDPPPGRRWA